MINFPFGTNGKSIILGVPILKHITVDPMTPQYDMQTYITDQSLQTCPKISFLLVSLIFSWNYIQSTLVIWTSIISNNCLSRIENLVLV